MVELLIKYGFDVNAKRNDGFTDGIGMTSLEIALQEKKFDIAKIITQCENKYHDL